MTGVVLDAFEPLYLEDMGHEIGSIDATLAMFQGLGERYEIILIFSN